MEYHFFERESAILVLLPDDSGVSHHTYVMVHLFGHIVDDFFSFHKKFAAV